MKGLTEKQVIENREKYGSNKLPEPKMKKWHEFAKEAMTEKINMLMIMMSIVLIGLAVMGVSGFAEPMVMLGLIILLTVISTKTNLAVQRSAAELRAKTAVRYCDVIRDGKVRTINTDEIVVGDIVCVGMGQEIFADGYLIEGKVSVNNAAINGETKECKKTPVEGYVHVKTTSTDAYTNQNCLFAGTTVMAGEGKMLVTDVGVNTVNGDTLVKMQTLEAPKTALDIALDDLSDFISKWGTIAATITFIVLTVTGILEIGFSQYFTGDILQTVLKLATNLSIALTTIVAAVPEGLPLIVKIVTQQNVKIMEKFNILAKNPGKIPELAYSNLICTDKTGTLTTGIMSPKYILDVFGNEISRTDALWNEIIKNVVLNNSATFDAKGEITGGNSIDRAVLSLTNAYEAGNIIAGNKQVDKQVFNSTNKYSAFSSDSGITYYKGAPEKIIEACTYAMNGKNSIPFDTETRKHLEGVIQQLTCKSIRCIALAKANGMLKENELPTDLTLLGVIGVMDPVRPEVPDAVKKAQQAGIQVIEITGDCIETAIAVAKECGIYQDGDVALTNDAFEKMTDNEVKEIIPKLRVISRCSPNTKLRLVTLAQEIGMSVGMTGDGVNDSPALKKADVGFGMQSGSDVAKEASDIILTDDNFASVVKGVELGRTFMHNIMMFLEFQLPINFSLLILSIVFPMLSGVAILASVQILLINIIMDSLNSLSFGGEPPKEEYMTERPIKKGSGLFIRGAKARIAVSTCSFIGIYALLLVTPIRHLFETAELSLTARFALLCLMAVFNGFNIRTESMNLFKGLQNNKLFVEIAAGIIVGVLLICSFAGDMVSVTAMDTTQWIVVFGLALLVIPVDLIRKMIVKKKGV